LDCTIQGVRFRESLETSDWREAATKAKERISELKQGKGASQFGKAFSRLSFERAADLYLEERIGRVSERTNRLEKERLRPLRGYFGDKPLIRISASDIAAYQKARRATVPKGRTKPLAGRTINLELAVLRGMMRRGRCWSLVAEDVTRERENEESIARVLTPEQKRHLFETAATRGEWLVAHCAAVLAASTTCRGVELKNLRWQDVDLFEKTMTVRRSKTRAGLRLIPLNSDAIEAFVRLRKRSEALAEVAPEPEHCVFPACESGRFNPERFQKNWRSAWRSLTREAARSAGRSEAGLVLAGGGSLSAAKSAYRRAHAAFNGFRFHDLRHQAITELAESGASDATIMSLAGHLSRKMLEHYSHIRTATKMAAVSQLEGGFMRRLESREEGASGTVQ
jgi:integrase